MEATTSGFIFLCALVAKNWKVRTEINQTRLENFSSLGLVVDTPLGKNRDIGKFA
jgi:hypothetical protein